MFVEEGLQKYLSFRDVLQHLKRTAKYRNYILSEACGLWICKDSGQGFALTWHKGHTTNETKPRQQLHEFTPRHCVEVLYDSLEMPIAFLTALWLKFFENAWRACSVSLEKIVLRRDGRLDVVPTMATVHGGNICMGNFRTWMPCSRERIHGNLHGGMCYRFRLRSCR